MDDRRGGLSVPKLTVRGELWLLAAAGARLRQAPIPLAARSGCVNAAGVRQTSLDEARSSTLLPLAFVNRSLGTADDKQIPDFHPQGIGSYAGRCLARVVGPRALRGGDGRPDRRLGPGWTGGDRCQATHGAWSPATPPGLVSVNRLVSMNIYGLLRISMAGGLGV